MDISNQICETEKNHGVKWSLNMPKLTKRKRFGTDQLRDLSRYFSGS